MRTYLGAKHTSSAYMKSTPASLQAATMLSASVMLRHIGFSSTTCLPAAAQSSTSAQWVSLGVPMATMSMSSRSMSGRWSVQWWGSP